MKTAARVAAVLIALSLAACGSSGGGGSTSTARAPSTTPGTETPAPISSSAPTYPVSITNCGRTYTYKSAPRRVVLGWPRDADTMTALGLGAKVVGYIAGKFGPAPTGIDAKKLSDEYTVSPETMLAAEPDFFLANGDSQLSGSQGTVTPKDLEAVGAHAYVMSLNCMNNSAKTTVTNVYTDITNLGMIFGVPERAAALITKLKARVAAATADSGATRPRLAYVNVYQDKLYALNGDLYNTQIVGAGGTNLLAGLKMSFSEISAEKVLTLDADAIVCEYNTSAGDTAAKQTAAVRAVLGDSPSGRDTKIIAVPDYLAEAPGVAAIEAVEYLAKRLYS